MQENDLRLSDGRTLHVYDTGNGDLPVFWNHGTPNLGAPPAPLLAESERLGIRWISFDRPGYGGSSPAPGRTMASVAYDAAAVADELGIDRFAVAGYSGGGSYALGCAATLGERVTAAVTLAAIAPYGVQGLDWFDGMVPSGVASLRAALGGRDVKAAHEASGVEYDPEFTKDDFALFDGEWGWLGSVASHGLDAGPYGLIDDDISYVTPWGCDPVTIQAPILLLHGERDRIIPASHGAWLAAHCPTAELRLAPEASHFTIFDEVGVLLPWLAGHR
ncbi:pimeloyl-ACP methyl ester carboxylesterase [Kribbella voronezhensis]|uniref:Pimeloyl-ACP methyl ester carboxylesterase n=1 Tax=Kribbella voronezhensis TaxID=2512212 RepID=A0A4R7T9L9_9ACTN|nr:alpha/beta hydrolase [Kribbella voronezhensis]TDU88682.1 pimeloyl-ACP methyl ester carboxylesterase [Kribbella voronezhensis]